MIANNKFICTVQGSIQSHEEAPTISAVRNNGIFQLLIYGKNDDHNDNVIQRNSEEENIIIYNEVGVLFILIRVL